LVVDMVVGGRRVCVCEAISGTRLGLSTSLDLEGGVMRKEEVLGMKVVGIVRG
jgi:hypothetical protein